MKITKLKINGKKPDEKKLEKINKELRALFSKNGFIADVNVEFGHIGLHMRSFRIDVKKIGHNARFSRWGNTLVGWKRTDVPTWEQRVEFNDIVNNVFDKHKITAKITSGNFLVRSDELGALTERDWFGVSGWFSDGSDIRTLTKDMIVEAKETRKRLAREKRAKQKENNITEIKNYLKNSTGVEIDLNSGENTGWFFWFCFPGCLPECDPFGPFETEKDALENALITFQNFE